MPSHIGALVVKNLPANAGDTRDATSTPGVGRSSEEEMATCSSTLAWKSPWFHGERSQAGYSPWSCKDSNTTELLSTHTHTHTHIFAITS